ncbi:MAG: PDZ domain-containing protein [Gemmatimonadaceae bacterium]
MLHRDIGIAALAVMLLPWYAVAQERERTRERTPAPRAQVWTIGGDAEERAALGVGTSSGGERDTLGLLITSITPGGPAEQAGLEEGNRIAAINGTRLTLSSVDAGEPDMSGILSRRLTRELRKLKPGDEVELRVYDDGQFRNIRVKTIAAADLPSRKRIREIDLDERPVLGLGLGTSGSDRDTLGVFVSSVLEDGPAEKAGIFEGDRIAAINGVDVRVRSEDAGDAQIASARIQRFRREITKAKPGDAVELRVWSGGGYRNVRVTLGKASDFRNRRGMSFHFGDFDFAVPAIAPMPPMPPMPMFHGEFDFDFNIDQEAIGEAAREAVRVSATAMRTAAAEARAHAAHAAREERWAARYSTGWF